ncbi:MAG: shikimate dehydrogenase family protein [Candidatus Eiseniibacteriota bacterium]
MTGSPVRLGVLGDPLEYTRSPDLHRAGLAALGLDGESSALPTPVEQLGARLDDLAARGFRGVNLTRPLKAAVLPFLGRVSGAAAEARSVNTVGFTPDGWWGETTDGPGLIDLLHDLGREPGRERVVMLGGGGAARSLALALAGAGAEPLTVRARKPAEIADTWRGLPGARLVPWRSQEEAVALGDATLVVNATPLGGDEGPAPLDRIARSALILDLVYGERVGPWVLRARAEGREAYDGLGLLVFQARRSLALWLARRVPLDPLARAVGWPR